MPSAVPKSCVLFLLLALAGASTTGCVCSLHPANPPSWHTLRILAHGPERYLIRVDDAQPHRAGFDGLVSFEVPPLQPGCKVYLFGLVKVADHSPEAIPAVQVLRGSEVVRRLSLKQLAKLPLDSDGCRLLRLH